MLIVYYLCRIGDLRLRLPKPIEQYNGTIDATKVGPQCIQQMLPLREDMPAEMFGDVIAALSRNIAPAEPMPESEDCTPQRLFDDRPTADVWI